MAKILGFVLLIIGIALLIYNLALVKTKLNIPAIPVLSTLKPLYITIAGGILLAIGLILIFKKSSGKQGAREVPIYEGGKIIGYRRR